MKMREFPSEKEKNLDLEKIRNILDYNKDTGILRWKRTYLVQKIGNVATGVHTTKGYLRIRLNNKSYLAHRIIWFIVYGKFPLELIDHINGNKSDNRLINLREATYAQNQYNTIGNNIIGLKGVYKSTKCNSYEAKIKINRKSIYLGSFKTAEEAHEAYKIAAIKYFKEFSNFNSK